MRDLTEDESKALMKFKDDQTRSMILLGMLAERLFYQGNFSLDEDFRKEFEETRKAMGQLEDSDYYDAVIGSLTNTVEHFEKIILKHKNEV